MKQRLLITLPLDEFNKLLAGTKSFFVQRFKDGKAPAQGDRILLQAIGSDTEIDTIVQDVHNEPGVMKGWVIISVPILQQEVTGQAAIDFNITLPNLTTNDEPKANNPS